MWKKSFLVFLFSLSVQKAALDCETMKKTNEFLSPKLSSKTDAIMKGQNVSLICSNENKSLQITYDLFQGMKHLIKQQRKGEPMIFNISISEPQDLGPYKCKAQVSNCSKYSQQFNFIFVEPVTTPVLNISAVQTETHRYITLRCISFNGSLPINYTFFEKDSAISPTISKNVREPAEFNLTKRNTGEGEEYRCEAKNRLSDHAEYSRPFTRPAKGADDCPFCLQLLLPGLLLLLIVIILILAFWILPKYKTTSSLGLPLGGSSVHEDRASFLSAPPEVLHQAPVTAFHSSRLMTPSSYDFKVAFSFGTQEWRNIEICTTDRKAMRDNAPRDYGYTPKEVGIYANICQNQADEASVPGLEPRQCVSTAQDGTGHSHEIHYATPVFQEVAPGDQEACNDCKTGYVYSELNF